MAKFKINDQISQLRYGKEIAKGIVTAGPFRVEKVDHYHVKWNWTEDGLRWKNTDNDLICDLPSKKYQYI